MKPIDKHYLKIQFELRVIKLNATSYQNFFETLMEMGHANFKKIRPYGNQGDGGNDGYIRNTGTYYQVYSPLKPEFSDAEAAQKMVDDFNKLKSNWDKIASINKYVFVYNDNFRGSITEFENNLTILGKENPGIDFKLLLSNDLEKEFFLLSNDDFISLGFNVEQRNSVQIINEYINLMKQHLDSDYVSYVNKNLDFLSLLIDNIDDDNLEIEYELLKITCLQKLEKFNEALANLKSLKRLYPGEIKIYHHLANHYFLINNINKHKKYIAKLEAIDASNWTVLYGKAIAKQTKNQEIDIDFLKNHIKKEEPKIKSHFYQMFSLEYAKKKDFTKAYSHIFKAIKYNEYLFSNYLTNLLIIEQELMSCTEFSEVEKTAQKMIKEINRIRGKFSQFGDISNRKKATLNTLEIKANIDLRNYTNISNLSDTMQLLHTCRFDISIESLYIILFELFEIPNRDFSQILEKISISDMEISLHFAETIFFQFTIKEKIFTEGRSFFESLHLNRFVSLIDAIENEDVESIIIHSENQFFLSTIISSLSNHFLLKSKIIESIPNIDLEKKNELLFSIFYQEQNFIEAYNIIKCIDIMNVNFYALRKFLHVVQELEIIDDEINILKRLIEFEKDQSEIFSLSIQLFNSYKQQNNSIQVISLGEQLLLQNKKQPFLTEVNKERLLGDVIDFCIDRGKIEEVYLSKASHLLIEYRSSDPSFEFLIAIESNLYLLIGNQNLALQTIINAIKKRKVLAPKEYALMAYHYSLTLGDFVDLSYKGVKENSFVKIKSPSKWYYFGDENELDTIKVPIDSEKYHNFIGRKVGDKIETSQKYRSSSIVEEIEEIASIEGYIEYQTKKYFNELSISGDLKGIQVIDIPHTKNGIDLTNLEKQMEDIEKPISSFFKEYGKNQLPLSIFATACGSFQYAIGHINKNNLGYINCNSGNLNDFIYQKETAKKVLNNNSPFYIDLSSAFYLIEYGLLEKILTITTNIKIPLSVINYLIKYTSQFTRLPNQFGFLNYINGQVFRSNIDPESDLYFKEKFSSAISILEKNQNNIIGLALSKKLPTFTENIILPEMCDACILARNENIPVLTEDYQYLLLNELQNNLKMPNYFSIYALSRVLYEMDKFEFKEFLDFFEYLSINRFRFLHIFHNDLDLALFGEKPNNDIDYSNLRKFHLEIILSEEYGVPFEDSLSFLSFYLAKKIVDETISIEIVNNLFREFIEILTNPNNRKNFPRLLFTKIKNSVVVKDILTIQKIKNLQEIVNQQ